MHLNGKIWLDPYPFLLGLEPPFKDVWIRPGGYVFDSRPGKINDLIIGICLLACTRYLGEREMFGRLSWKNTVAWTDVGVPVDSHLMH